MVRKFEDIKPNREVKYTPKKEEVSTPRIYKPEIKQEEFFFTKKEKRIPVTPREDRQKKSISSYLIVIFILAALCGLVYLYGEFFESAKVTLTKKHQEIVFKNKQFVIQKGDGTIDFEIMITSDKKEKDIILTESDESSSKSKGSVVLYNEFSQTVERIPSGTFLADDEGKTYKTDSSVVIPGYKLDSSKKIIPGQIGVKITAFLPGDAYNGTPENFYITPFKDTAKYKKIYGKLKDPLSGGSSGLVYKLDESSKESLNKIASESFRNDVFKKVRALVPPGYILYEGASKFSYSFDENFVSKTQEAQIELNGDLSVILLKENSLEKNIIKVSLPEIKGEEQNEITVPDINKLEFSFLDKDQIISKDMQSFSFLLNGTFDAVWNPNIEVLKSKLTGIHKKDVLSIFRQDPGISSAIVKIIPPWFKYMPNNPSKIEIVSQ